MALTIRFYGHTSLCLEHNATAVFAHPHFSAKQIFHKRQALMPPTDLLGKVHTILLSSGRFSDFDLSSFKFFSTHTTVLAPARLGTHLSHYLSNPIVELKEGSDTHYRDLHIEGYTTKTIHGLRPFRGCDAMNFLLEWEKKIALIFHKPSEATLQAWASREIDILFLSVDETPWRNLFFSKTQLPAFVEPTIKKLRQVRRIVPIGWGGFAASALPRAFLAWQAFAASLSAEEQAKITVLYPGQSLEVQ